ncbi:MAG: hypothetical protein ACTSUE_20375 [Promethearchaeota archaeon]
MEVLHSYHAVWVYHMVPNGLDQPSMVDVFIGLDWTIFIHDVRAVPLCNHKMKGRKGLYYNIIYKIKKKKKKEEEEEGDYDLSF